MKLKSTVYFAWCMGLLWILMFYSLQFSQAQETIERLAIQTLNGQVMIYIIDEVGQVTETTEANQTINTAMVDFSPAILQSPSDVVISPDGTSIAFVAYSLDGSNQVILFVYSFEDNTIVSTSLPGYGLAEWSSNGGAILLKPPLAEGFELYTILSDIYIYNLDQAALTQVTNTPTGRNERNVHWIPGTTTIVFSSEFQLCNTSCINSVQNLFAVETDGTGHRQITDLDIVLPVEPIPYGRCLTQDVRWNLLDQRLYFVVSCEDGDRELLMSTTLAGAVQLEMNLSALFPATEISQYAQLQVSDYHIGLLNNRVIVVTSVEENWLDSPTTVKSVHVYHLIDTNILEIFTATIPVELFFSTSDINIVSNTLGIGFFDATSAAGGALQAVNLTSGTQTQLLSTGKRVCNLTWLDENRIVYDQLTEGFCRGAANEVKIWNIQTNEVLDVGIMDGVQIVRRSEAELTHTPELTLTFTPTHVPTPAINQQITLTSMCSFDPVSVRVWRVYNPNPIALDFTWDVLDSTQTGSGTVPLGTTDTPGEISFQTTTVSGENITRIFVNGVLNDTKPSTPHACTTPTPSPTETPSPTPMVTLIETEGSTTITESGATDTYTLALGTQPTADVTVSIEGDAQITVSPSTLTFTPENWDVPQMVTVSAVDDSVVEGTHTAVITHSAASADAGYNGIVVADVTVSIGDNDGHP